MVECPTCKGDGTVFCKSIDYTKNPPTKTGFDLPCHTCDGKCEITEDKLKAIEAMDSIMCSCDSPSFGSYPQDGECNCGMHKHHVHCGTCGKISQIG